VYEDSYEPPFVYGHKCASSVITAFVPIILSSYAVSALYALFQVVIMIKDVDFKAFPSSVNVFMEMFVLPNLISAAHKAAPLEKNEYDIHLLVEAHTFIATQVNNLAVMMTFGLCSPYVAVAVAFTGFIYYRRCITLLWYYTTSQLARNSNAEESSRESAVSSEISSKGRVLALLNIGFFEFWRLSSRKVWTFVASISSVVIGLVVFDMASDEMNESTESYSGFFFSALSVVMTLYFVGKFYIGDALRRTRGTRKVELAHTITAENPILDVTDIMGQSGL
jgi:hypothetical protein